MAKSAEILPFFLGCYANVSVFSREIKEPPTYLSSKNKKIRDRVDSRVQLVWRLRVMGSWRDHWNIKEPYEGINKFYLDTIKIIRPILLSPSGEK